MQGWVMDIYYELFDHSSATLLKEYDSEAEAWDDLQAFSEVHGMSSLEGLALLRVTNAVPKLVAMDDDLIGHVRRQRAFRQAQRTSGAATRRYDVRYLLNTRNTAGWHSASSTASFHGIEVCVA